MEFTDKISNSKGLTEGQEKALDLIIKWYKSPNSPAFCLSGRAGTGKTYVVKALLELLNTIVCVTAPTHKAVHVIENATGKKGKTFQSLHGLRPNTNLETFDLNNLQFDALGQPTIQNYKLIICDECSMVNTDLHSLNIKRALDLNVKILYLGDPYQLPPVHERLSSTFLVRDTFELTEIVRQEKDNPLMNVLDLLIKDIQSNQSADFLRYMLKNRSQSSAKNEGYKLITSLDEFYAHSLNHFKSDNFSKDIDYARIAAWKNDTVSAHNNYMRKNIIPHFTNSSNSEKLELIDINDVLTGYKTITNEFNETTLINSEDYLIKSIVPKKERDFNIFEIDVIGKNSVKTNTIKIADYTNSNFMIYYELLKRYYLTALWANPSKRKAAWKEFFNFKNEYLTLVSFDIKHGTDIRNTIVKDIDYGFSLTTHKLQGSTVNHIFVDLHDMMYYSNNSPVLNNSKSPYAVEIRNKLVYTAISRSKNFAYIYFPYNK